MAIKYYIVWNEPKSEGFITDDYADALTAATGQSRGLDSTLALEFFENYGETEHAIQEIEL